ncbi:MAG TPA: PAS domain S-box protein, partial [Anaeromyxobacteraceae bacterium]|nr:PAS domain S-box protein [Anaeromyxobacteraceae bacterium]
AERLLGFRASEAIGQAVDIIIPPERRDEERQFLARISAGERIVHVETQRVAKGGAVLDVSITVSPVRDAEGRIIGASKTVRDITAQRRAAASSRERDAQFRTLLENVHSGVALVGPDGSFSLFNRRFLEMFGLSETSDVKNVNDQNWSAWQVFSQEGRLLPVDEHPVRKATLRKEPVRDELVGVRPPAGAELIWMLVSAEPLLGSDGRIQNVICTFHDITQQRQVEQARRRSEEEARERAVQLEAVLNCVADGVMVYDREGRTVLSSPAADAILQIPASERQVPVADRVMRQYEILSEDGRRLSPDDTVAVRAAVRGEKVRGVMNRVRSGHNDPRWLIISAMPLVVSGKHTGAVVSLTDVTDRKRAAEELAVVNRLYAVLSRVNEAIVRAREEQPLYQEVCQVIAEEGGLPLVWLGLVQGQAVVPTASAGRATDYLRGIRVEVDGELGQGPTGTSIREDRPVIIDDFVTNQSTGPWREACRQHGLHGAAAFPVRRGGKVIGALMLYAAKAGVFTVEHMKLFESLSADISYALDSMQQERLRAEAELALRENEGRLRLANEGLREAHRRKDEFLAMLSHELRNPLAPIRNSVYILEHTDPTGQQATRARAVVKRQVEHMTRLVDDLLDVTRVSRGKIELQRDRVDLREVVVRAAEDYRLAMSDRGIAFRTSLPGAKIWVNADVTRIAQVVTNLLHNALKFTRSGDEVILSLHTTEDCAEIGVRDTGIGIDPELLPRLFEAFVQGKRTLARTEGGLGLGLALVKGIAELHGGSVRVESEGVGKGAEFVVRLPIAAPAVPHEQPDAPVDASKSRRRVLVVEDNRDAAESLAELVKLFGHAVEVAYDGPSAVEKALAGAPDIVLCDVGLPGMSGFEVARRLRASSNGELRIIAVSGYAQPADVNRAVEAGFDGLVAKPFEPVEIERLLA